MQPTLLTVKFSIPSPRTTLTKRSQLLDRFSSGFVNPVTLISAPAGFGKSTFLSTWLIQYKEESQTTPTSICCWLTLDSKDNQETRFWTYFVAAIQNGMNRLQMDLHSPFHLNLERLLAYLQSEPPPLLTTVIDQLINAISQYQGLVILVLDDYYVIQDAEIHDQVTYLLEHQPPNLNLVISTRVDPPLPIARLRARRQLNELRAADLRFTEIEAQEFFNTVTGLSMSNEEINAIQASTEGWIAGLQMAALALQAQMTEGRIVDDKERQQKIKDFIFSFSGKNMYILDYLTDEVFNNQKLEVQTFLLKTSILERMSIGLCAAILNDDNEQKGIFSVHDGAAHANAKEILDYLEKANLFLIRLDDERRWFRYHHLFSDLLRARLEQIWPDIEPVLHRKASQWYEDNGFVDDAIQHAILTKDWGLVAVLMERHVTSFLELGQLASVLKWIALLPNDILCKRPVLCSQAAWALTQAGQFQRVPPLIAVMEAALSSADTDEAGKDSLFSSQQERIRVQGIHAVLRAFGSFLAGDPARAMALVKDELEKSTGFEPRELTWLNWMCGYAYRGLGQLDQAIHYFEIALNISQMNNTDWVDMSTDLGIAYRLSGRLTQATEVFQKALQQAELKSIRNKGNLSRVEAFFSAVLLDQNQLEEALLHAQKGIYYLQWWPSHNHITTVNLYLSQIFLGMGRIKEAEEALQRAEHEKNKGQVMPVVIRQVAYVSLRLWELQGRWDLLDQWLSSQETALPDTGTGNQFFNENEHLHQMSKVRVWLAKGRKDNNPMWFEQAFLLLSQLAIPAQNSHWVHALVEIYLLQAILLYEIGKTAGDKMGDDMGYLTKSLAIGLPAGFLRIYLQEGLLMVEMLKKWLKSPRIETRFLNLKPIFVKNLLDQFELESKREVNTGKGQLIEPLTEREQEVLQLLALGLTNKDMAERLVVSEGTIKTHVHNLIGKLGAQNRTQVLARAKELDLLG